MYKVSRPYVLLSATYRLIYTYCHGDGSGGAHLYTKYHGCTQHYVLVTGYVLPWQHVTWLVKCG